MVSQLKKIFRSDIVILCYRSPYFCQPVPYEKEMSGKCHQKCPENVRSVRNLSGILIKTDVRNFFMSGICPDKFWACKIPDIFRTNKPDKFRACKILDKFQTNKTR